MHPIPTHVDLRRGARLLDPEDPARHGMAVAQGGPSARARVEPRHSGSACPTSTEFQDDAFLRRGGGHGVGDAGNADAGASPRISKTAATGQLVQDSGQCSSISNPQPSSVRAIYRNVARSSGDPERRTVRVMCMTKSSSRSADTLPIRARSSLDSFAMACPRFLPMSRWLSGARRVRDKMSTVRLRSCLSFRLNSYLVFLPTGHRCTLFHKLDRSILKSWHRRVGWTILARGYVRQQAAEKGPYARVGLLWALVAAYRKYASLGPSCAALHVDLFEQPERQGISAS